MKMFASDNNSGVHPKILEAIVNEGSKYGSPYGNDETTKRAEALILETIGREGKVFFTTTGTSANIIGLSSVLRPFEAVVAVDSAHINVDECNALENFNGSKIITVPGVKGKLTIENIKPTLDIVGDVHSSQPKILSISQLTETGNYYTVEEIKELADFAHENNMYLHVDGARIANALEVTGASFKEMIGDTGVDLFSFGGTKNGMMIGEAIVSFIPEFYEALHFRVKQGMQLLSKMRYIAVQFIAYLEDDLYLKNAKQANSMGRLLAEELEKLDIELVDYSGTNQLFMRFEEETREKLLQEFEFYLMWEDVSRLVTSFDTTEEDIKNMIKIIK